LAKKPVTRGLFLLGEPAFGLQGKFHGDISDAVFYFSFPGGLKTQFAVNRLGIGRRKNGEGGQIGVVLPAFLYGFVLSQPPKKGDRILV